MQVQLIQDVCAFRCVDRRHRPGREAFNSTKIGLSLILLGTLAIIGWHGTAWNISRSIGYVLFLVASFLTAGYTVIMRKSKLDPVHVAALVATGSLVVYAPLYFGIRGLHLAQVPVADLTIQVIFQGVVVTIISPVLYCRAVLILGASTGSAFGAFGARAIGGACHTSPGRTADSIRLGGHRSHIGRCVPRERGAAAANASRIIDDAQSSHNDRHPESFRFPSF